MKRILVLNFFPAFVPPKSGGEQRYYHFYRHLSAKHDVTLLSPTYSDHREELVHHHDHFREYRVPKEDVHDRLHALVDQDRICSECSALVCALSARYPNRYHRLYLQLYPQADVIIHEFPYMLEYDLFFAVDGKPRIYNSHNFEWDLVKQLWTGPQAAKYQRYIHCLEDRLVSCCDRVFTVSPAEREAMAATYGVDPSTIGLAPNGIDPTDYPYRRNPVFLDGCPQACFIGTRHPPNLEAARFLAEEVAPRCPGIRFVMAGTCCDELQAPLRRLPTNVHILGIISEERKKQLLETSLIALNPLTAGAGTNLKTLEYLAAGLPLLTTQVGVRGLELQDGRHFIGCERSQFADALSRLVDEPNRLEHIAANGRQAVLQQYSWAKIVEDFAACASALERRSSGPLLVLNDFPVKDRLFGGATRIRNLYKAVSRHRPVVLMTLHNDGTLERHDHGRQCVELSFPKSARHLQEENSANAAADISINDIVAARHCRDNDLFRQALEAVLPAADALVLSHPYLAPMIEGRPAVPVIYESHNFEYRLKQQLLAKHPAAERLGAEVADLEAHAMRISSLVIAVSHEDAAALTDHYRLNKSVEIVSNGVDLERIESCRFDVDKVRRIFNGLPTVAFIGSAHRPNVEALEYIIDELAPAFADVYFLVIGNVCDAVCRPLPQHVLFFRQVDDLTKTALLKLATIAVNPIFSGSGSNLKLADYFAHGLATLTTEFGARGYAIEAGHHALIASRQTFSKQLRRLLDEPKLRCDLARQALDYVRAQHDWVHLGERYNSLLGKHLWSDKRPRLLVVTHRFTLPPLGGAELYLWKVLQQLDARGSFRIDIVAPAIHQLDNRMHFATAGTPAKSACFEQLSDHLCAQRFPLEMPADRDAAPVCRALHRLWYEESIRLSLDQVAHYDHPMLMGGWNYPERQEDGSIRIWSSQRSLIWVRGLDSVHIKGYSVGKRKVFCRLDNAPSAEKKWRGTDRWTLTTGGASVLELGVEDPHCPEDDPRLLGIQVESIEGRAGSERRQLDLGHGFRDHLKQHHLNTYLQALTALAISRDPAWDEQFLRMRGPASADLEAWISNHLAEYDVVLGHGIPFQPLVYAARQAFAMGKPHALLPHFHFDDEFYHWRCFYEAMQRADCVFAFPQAALPLFYEPLDILTQYLPGGAVDPQEFVGDHRAALHQVHRPQNPFFLVLGRKSGSKNYAWAINAVRELNRKGKVCELLMIGPDDDRQPLSQEDALYLGMQPREVVLGALQDCVAVINMSASESFGMVLLEAWMCGKPVVVNRDCRAFRELVQDRANGLVADRLSLQAALQTLLDQPDLAARLGQKGLQTVGADYTWQRIADTIEQVLLRLAAKPGEARPHRNRIPAGEASAVGD